MGNYNVRKKGYLTGQQIMVVEAVFAGRSNEWIYTHIYNAKKGDHKSIISAARKLTALKKNPKFHEYYESMVTEFRVHGYGKAMHKLVDLVDDPNPWVAIQASNSVVNHSEKAVISNEENTVTVKIEGLPTLGVPPQDEVDALPDPNEQAYLEARDIVEAVESSVI